jgi:hypothetical protein
MADDGAGDERLRVLQLLEEGKISAAEAADLLAALRQPAPPAGRARWFRVRVTDQRTGRTRTNVSVPIGMLGFGLGFARKLRRVPGMEQVDDLFEAVRSGRRGVIFDVENEGGERVEILID